MFTQQDSLMCVFCSLKWELTAAESCCRAFSQALVNDAAWWKEQPIVAVSPGVHASSDKRQVELQLEVSKGRGSRLCSKRLVCVLSSGVVLKSSGVSAISLKLENSSCRLSSCQASSSHSSLCCVHMHAHSHSHTRVHGLPVMPLGLYTIYVSDF